MKVYGQNLKCTGKREPNYWEFNGDKGVTYTVEMSDGERNILLKCADEQVYNMIEPWQSYSVELELIGTNFNGRNGVKTRITGVERES